MPDQGLLEVKSVGCTLGNFRAIDDVSFTVPAGGRHGVIGPNGAGKSTLFNVLSGYIRGADGNVTLDGERISGQRADQVVKSGVLRTFQAPNVLLDWSVEESIRLAAEQSRSRIDVSARVAEAAHAVGLSTLLSRAAGSLNMAERRRLSLAMCVAHHPVVLMLDEPTAGLDDRETSEFAELLAALHERYEFTVALVEHKLSFLMSFCTSITVLDAGKVIASGSPAEISVDPTVIEAYLGTDSHE